MLFTESSNDLMEEQLFASNRGSPLCVKAFLTLVTKKKNANSFIF